MIVKLSQLPNGAFGYSFVGKKISPQDMSFSKMQMNIARKLVGKNNYRVSSTGSAGILDENDNPASGTIVVLQQLSGLWVETGRVYTEDGGFNIDKLPIKTAKIIATKDTYNDGIVSKITPESM